MREGDHYDFLQRVQAAIFCVARQKARGIHDPDYDAVMAQLHEWAFDFRMLRCALEHLIAHGGQAPGPNGRRPRDIDWEFLRVLSQGLHDGLFQPGQLRRVMIPKPGRRGRRPLDIPNVMDRLVERAVLTVVGPLLDVIMPSTVHGFRPWR